MVCFSKARHRKAKSLPALTWSVQLSTAQSWTSHPASPLFLGNLLLKTDRIRRNGHQQSWLGANRQVPSSFDTLGTQQIQLSDCDKIKACPVTRPASPQSWEGRTLRHRTWWTCVSSCSRLRQLHCAPSHSSSTKLESIHRVLVTE